MRVELKPNTVQKIEKMAGMKLTTRCDRVINKALDVAAENKQENEVQPQVKMPPEMLEMIQNG